MNQVSVVEEALEAISPVLEGRIVAQGSASQQSDALVELVRPGMVPVQFVAVVDRIHRRSDIAWHSSSKPHPSQQDHRQLLIAPHVSAALADECRQAGVNFLDAAGNAHIDVPGLYLYITGRKPIKASASVADQSALRRASTMRVIFALLTIDGLVLRPVREIAQSAGVALGSTSEALAELEGLGFVAGRARKRSLANRPLLVTEWARQYPISLRDKLQPARYASPGADWWRTVQMDPAQSVWGAEVAAALLTEHLVPEQCCIYAWADRRALMLKHRLRPDPEGPIEILDAFWPRPSAQQLPIAPALLVYADLMASNDGRNMEVAKMLEPGLLDA